MYMAIQRFYGRCMLAGGLGAHPVQAVPQAFVVFGTGVG